MVEEGEKQIEIWKIKRVRRDLFWWRCVVWEMGKRKKKKNSPPSRPLFLSTSTCGKKKYHS